nr:serine/arginine repetitive matrix protein 2 [Clostridia bacterium]
MKTPLTLTRHNARAGKKGVYSPKHNDRSFDVDHAEHIDPEKTALNVYWDCMQGIHMKDPDQTFMTFEEVESQFYRIVYHESVEAQNERNIRNRHSERNRTTEDLLKDRRTCPEESILQIGNISGTVPPEVLAEIAAIFFSELTSRYGDHFHILDWALHLDETTPHIQERHVFDCEDKYGHRFPQQEKALEMMGIELPDPSKPKSAQNCRKVTFDKICRELLFEICENHDLYMQREVTTGGREYLEKQQYILQARAEELAKAEAALEAVTMKLEDADAVAAEVAEAAYEKAVEVVTDTVQAETVKTDLGVIEDYRKWVTSPERRTPKETRSVIGKALDAVRNRITQAASKVLERVRARLHEPAVREANTAEIRKTAKESLLKKLKENQETVRRTEASAPPDRKRKQNIEH